MFWIDAPGPGRVGIAARPRAGDWLDDEVAGWQSASVNVVVSLLEPNEVHDLGLETEAAVCERSGLTFLTFPLPDRGVPASLAKTRELIVTCRQRLAKGESVLIHCRAGIGRSALIAACILVAEGVSAEDAFDRIADARGLPVPDTVVQAKWAAEFTAA